MRSQNKTNAIFLIGAFVAMGLVWHRALFGVDVTDESFWIAEPFLVTKGAVPFADLWIQSPSTSLLIAPFVSLYELFAHERDGIYIYMMHIAVLFRAVVSLLIYIALKKRMDLAAAGAIPLAMFCCAMGRLKVLNYNMLSLYLLALAGALILDALQELKTAKAALLYGLTGIIMAGCALAHISQIINCAFFAVLLLCLERRRVKGVPLWCIYVLSGFAVALLTVIGMEAASGGKLFSGLAILLKNNNYFEIPKLPFWTQVMRSLYDLKAFGLPGFMCFCAILGMLYLFSQHNTDFREDLKKNCILSFAGSACALLGGLALKVGEYSSDYSTFILYLTVPVLLLVIEQKDRSVFYWLMIFWVPCLLSWLSVSIIAYAPANYRYYTMTTGALLYIPLLSRTAKSAFTKTHVGNAVTFLLTVCFMFSFLVASYRSIYSDDPIEYLDYRIESGVYKGMITSYERGKRIEQLETAIREATANTDSLLISDLFPMGYLMADSVPFTPTTWDPPLYRGGFRDMNLLQAYFDMKGTIPDKILFVNSEGIPLSIDDPESEFSIFVKNHYVCTKRIGEGQFSMRVYEKVHD